jgi:ATP-binding cassette subfamily B protein
MKLDSKPAFRSQHKVSVTPALKRLTSLTYPHSRLFVAGLLALGAGSGINLIFPEVVRRLLKPEQIQQLVDKQAWVVALVAGLFLLQGAAFFVRSFLFGLVGQRVYSDLRAKLFQSVLRREISFFDANRSSDLASRINSDAALVQDAVSVKFSVLIRYGIQVLFGVVLMLAMSWKLTFAIVLSVGLMVGISMLFVRQLKNSSRSYQTQLGRFTSFAAECFSGVKVIRALGALDYLREISSQYNEATRLAGEHRVWWSASFSSGASALLNILLLCIAWYGLSLVGYGHLPFNELAAFVLYGAIVAVSFSFLVSAYTELMQGLGGLERVFELLDSEPTDITSAQPLKESGLQLKDGSSELSLGVTCDSVSFSYPDRPEHRVLDQFSCRIEPGRCTALVGPSGCGKSSLVQILCKLYTITSGVINLEFAGRGVSLNEISPSALSRLVAWVPQDPSLFGFTIIENLMLGNKELTREQVQDTIRNWEFLDFIKPLEHGLDTMLGEHGALLSGGQRQRLAIARALLRKPALLILDEATSGLDSESEESVMRVIREYLPRTTILLISHRLATVSKADHICVMENGSVVEEGTHSQLSCAQGLYQHYSERQDLGL